MKLNNLLIFLIGVFFIVFGLWSTWEILGESCDILIHLCYLSICNIVGLLFLLSSFGNDRNMIK